jgi:hypothetical protein
MSSTAYAASPTTSLTNDRRRRCFSVMVPVRSGSTRVALGRLKRPFSSTRRMAYPTTVPSATEMCSHHCLKCSENATRTDSTCTNSRSCSRRKKDNRPRKPFNRLLLSLRTGLLGSQTRSLPKLSRPQQPSTARQTRRVASHAILSNE